MFRYRPLFYIGMSIWQTPSFATNHYFTPECPKPPVHALSSSRRFYRFPFCLFIVSNYHLGDTLSIIDCKILRRKVNQNNANFTSKICIHNPWRITYGYSLFNAKPLRGHILATYPSGSAICSPVGTRQRSSGFNTIGCSIFARMSIPAELAVAYFGNSCFDLFTISTFITLRF